MRTGVTTIRHADSSIIKEAKRRGEALGFPYIPRGDTLEEMTEENGLPASSFTESRSLFTGLTARSTASTWGRRC